MDTPLLIPEEHVERRGACCPNCGGQDLDYQRNEIDGADAWQPAQCHDCHTTWRDTYKLATHQDLDTLTGLRPGQLHASEMLLAEAGRCPNCTSNSIEADNEVDDGNIYQQTLCNHCEAEFTTTYRLTGYSLD